MSKIISSLALALMILLLGTGCSTETSISNVVEYEDFQKEFKLKSEVEEWLDLWECSDLRIYGKILVAIDFKRERIFHVYNLETKKLIGSFGRFGNGPNEYSRAPKFTSVYSYEGIDLIIQIYDHNRKTLQNINLTKSIEDGYVSETSKIKFPDISAAYSFMLNDSMVFDRDSSILLIRNPLTGELTYNHEAVHLPQSLPEKHEKIARYMYLEKAPNIDTIVSSFNIIKRLHIYNTKGELLKVIKEPGEHIFNTGKRDIYENNLIHFTRTFLSEKYILVLNQNRIIGEGTSGELLLFDYEGNALCKYELDCYIYFGGVDWESKRFYTQDIVGGSMVSFALPGIAD